MTTTDLVQFATFERAPRLPIELPAIAPSYHQLVSPVRSAIVCARRQLLRRQCNDGRWVGRQIGDASLPSQLLMLMAYFGREDSELAEQAANAILRDQVADGGWPVFPGGRADLSVSVQAYFALKLVGHKPNRPYMAAARQLIRELGGADGADATTRWFLAMFGQIDHDVCGSNVSAFGSMNFLPRRTTELSHCVRELYIAHPAQWPAAPEDVSRHGSKVLEFVRQAIDEHARKGDETITSSGDFEKKLRRIVVVDQERDEARPCLGMSPALDTALVCDALLQSGSRSRRFESCRPQDGIGPENAANSELAAEVRLMAAGICRDAMELALPPEIKMFGECNSAEFGTSTGQAVNRDGIHAAIEKRAGELMRRQNEDGGWSPDFPRQTHSEPAATAFVLRALSHNGIGLTRESTQRGVDYLRSTQRADGSWDSATGVRYVHGTASAISGLTAAGVAPEEPAVGAGVNWLLVHQQEMGGWGEAAPSSNTANHFIPAAGSAIQTAWAVSALVASGRATDDATLLGIQFLVDTQEEDGDWQDAQFTLRDPATAKWYRNDVHSAAESLAALSNWSVAASSEQATAGTIGLKLIN
jgi:Squalene-hopene cyclase N-terminal domain/Squalene-hopene cyclase C-terminal domain/Prenyltransferase and squalene oxidase repeat